MQEKCRFFAIMNCESSCIDLHRVKMTCVNLQLQSAEKH